MKENIEKSIRILDFVISQSDKTNSYFHKQKPDFITQFCLCMIERLNFSSVSLKALLKIALENSKVEYSCGIILRSVFLDSIILLNALEITGKTDQGMLSELNKFCFDMLGDSVKHTLVNFKDEYSQESQDTIKNMYSNLVAENLDFFELYANDGTPPVPKDIRKYTNKELVGNIKKSKDFNQRVDLYRAYLYYSKYDHFGHMFYSLSRKDFLIRLDNLNKAIREIPKAFLFAQSMLLFRPDTFLESQYREVEAFINAM